MELRDSTVTRSPTARPCWASPWAAAYSPPRPARRSGGAQPGPAPAAIGLLPGEADEYIITSGGIKGQRGFFTRDQGGAVVVVDLAGRLFTPSPDSPWVKQDPPVTL